MHSALLTAALTAAAVALAAAPAQASTEVKVVGSVLYVTALGPQRNDINLNFAGGQYIVDDLLSTAFANGGGCAGVSPNRVQCPMAGVTRAVVNTDGGDDEISGTFGLQHELHGGAGDDYLGGNTGIDTLDGGPGNDHLAGGSNIDLADYRGRTNGVIVTLDGIDNDGEPGEQDVLIGIEGVIGGAGNDTLSGSPAGDRLQGGPGRDTLRGEGGGDVLTGGPGDDDLYGGDGSDTFEADATTDGADAFNGGTGIWDHVTYARRTTGVFADLDGAADDGASGERDTIAADVENLTGGAADDVLVGDADPNQLTGGGGLDRLSGRLGDDTIAGGDGNDVAWGDDGVDNLNGGIGDDLLFGGAGNDTLLGRDFVTGNDALFGGADSDACTADTADGKTDCER